MGLLNRRKETIVVASSSPRKKQGRRLKTWLRGGGALVVALLIIAGAVRHGSHEASRRSTRLQIEQIVQAARLFRQDFGRCPHDPDELALPPAGGTPYLAAPPRDPWGNSYHFKCPGRWRNDEVDVGSPGPDGVFEGGDDMTTDL